LIVHSLYGKHRRPTAKMLDGLDLLLVDLQDVGARYYTFIWTLALCLEACAEAGVEVCVLDRPNPIGGVEIEGPVLDAGFASFVGLRPLPARHGMTIGEIASFLQSEFSVSCRLSVVRMDEWSRDQSFDETGLLWAPPSPNMPTPDTALVYPGMCLLEGTNLSEGRGTTRPFETIGAPFLDSFEFVNELADFDLPGVQFRPVQFQPTFQKYAGQICHGAFLHVVDRGVFMPVLAGVAALLVARRLGGVSFRWKEPPYEYELGKLPIDILAGNSWLREAVDRQEPLETIRVRMDDERSEFVQVREKYLLY
jgi:uncharacterized protein YbbC (DUF1343 family)